VSGRQNFRRGRVPTIAPLVCLALMSLTFLAPIRVGIAYADGPTYLYAQGPCTPVYTAASKQSAMITQLLGGTDVTLLDANKTWTHVRIWSGIEGFIPSSALGTQVPAHAREGVCNFPGLPDAEQTPLPVDAGPWPLTSQATVIAPATLHTQPDDTSLPVGALSLGQTVSITQWVGGSSQLPWYHLQAPVGSGWAWSAAVRLSLPDPATRQVQGKPIWSPVAGKGMWFVNYLPHHSDVVAMMRAAKVAGMTHVYAEVAISQFGFYANNTLDRLLPAAHAAGIKVIAWVYPDLKNVSDDIRLSQIVATYKAPSGDRPDGLAADIEGVNADGLIPGGSAYAYGQVLRGLLGPDLLMVAAVFHPSARPSYPYAEIAASFNVLAPMNYWHSRSGKAYSADDVRRFDITSITTIRAAMALSGAAELPIEELGQTYDMYSDDGTGGSDAPTTDEVTADMTTARDLGCIGVSFYEWHTATQAQWAAISSYSW
jgi:hypothetical protein